MIMRFLHIRTHKRTIVLATLALLLVTAAPAFAENLAIATARDEGSADPVHPAAYLVDGRSDTAFTARAGSSHAWVVLTLPSSKKILGLTFTGSGTGLEKYTIEYDYNGRFVPFLSGLGQSFG